MGVKAEEVIAAVRQARPRTVNAEMLMEELAHAGFKILPLEPTEAMRTAGMTGPLQNVAAADVYRAMWEAA